VSLRGGRSLVPLSHLLGKDERPNGVATSKRAPRPEGAPGRIRTCVKRIRSPLPKSARPPGHASAEQPDIGRSGLGAGIVRAKVPARLG
jgi:hypothetical protein